MIVKSRHFQSVIAAGRVVLAFLAFPAIGKVDVVMCKAVLAALASAIVWWYLGHSSLFESSCEYEFDCPMILNVGYVHGLVIGVLGVLGLLVSGFGYGGYVQYWRHIQRVDRHERMMADMRKRNIQSVDPNVVPLTSAGTANPNSGGLPADGEFKSSEPCSPMAVSCTAHEPV